MALAASNREAGSNDWFATTHWSVIMAAGTAETVVAQQALEKLCGTYWYPVYIFIRRHSHDDDEARDLTQGFFADILGRNSLTQVDPAKGRFRAFMLACVKNYLFGQRERTRADKRGGGRALLELDALEAEERYKLEPVDHMSPDVLYDRRWAITLIEVARLRLRDELALKYSPRHCDLLHALDQGNITYDRASEQIGSPVGTIKAEVSRLRTRLGELVREQIAHTVNTKTEIDEELRYLKAVLSKG
jgi:DNA-directed RNA polymerase specialized sigma24 family protein